MLHNLKAAKFDERTITGFLLNCLDDSYLVIDPTSGKIWRSKNVDFTESVTYGNVFAVSKNKSVFINCYKDITFEMCEKEGSSDENDLSPSRLINDVSSIDANLLEMFLDNEPLEAFNVGSDPETFQEAMSLTDSALWKVAIQEELDALSKNKTWILVKRDSVSPKDILTSRWLFRTKIEPSGSTRKKARLVIRGFGDRNTYDRTETYSPVIRLTDFRFLISVANKFNLELHQMDVKTAFLNGTLEKRIFMEIPGGITDKDKMKKEYICELKRSLYGLKVSPRRCYERFKEAIMKLGFSAYPFQSCIFSWRKQLNFVLVGLYVDDILITGNCDSKIKHVKLSLSQEFEMPDLKEPKKFLGIEISRNKDEGFTFIHQRLFIQAMLKRFNMLECNPVQTPAVTHDSQRKVVK